MAHSRPQRHILLSTLIAALLCGASAGTAIALPLQQALTGAEAIDGRLAAALANRDGAFENIAIARSRLLPQLSIQATNQHLDQTTTPLEPGGRSSEFKGRAINNQLVLRQALSRPRDWAGLSIGEQTSQIGALGVGIARAELWQRTVDLWIDAVAAQGMLGIQTQAADAVASAARQERQRLAQGNSTRDSVAEAEAQLAQAQALRAEAQWGLQARLQALRLHTGQDSAGIARLTLPDLAQLRLPFNNADEAIRQAVLANPEIQSASVQVEISRLRVRQALADRLPTIDIVGSISRADNDTNDNLNSRTRGTRIGLQLSVPIDASGGLSASQRQAEAVQLASMGDRSAVQQQLEQRLLADWALQTGYAERGVAADALIAAALEQRKAAEMGVRAGQRTWADVANAELLIARRQTDRLSNLAALTKALTRIVALFPADHPLWTGWTATLDAPRKAPAP